MVSSSRNIDDFDVFSEHIALLADDSVESPHPGGSVAVDSFAGAELAVVATAPGVHFVDSVVASRQTDRVEAAAADFGDESALQPDDHRRRLRVVEVSVAALPLVVAGAASSPSVDFASVWTHTSDYHSRPLNESRRSQSSQ